MKKHFKWDSRWAKEETLRRAVYYETYLPKNIFR